MKYLAVAITFTPSGYWFIQLDREQTIRNLNKALMDIYQ